MALSSLDRTSILRHGIRITLAHGADQSMHLGLKDMLNAPSRSAQKMFLDSNELGYPDSEAARRSYSSPGRRGKPQELRACKCSPGCLPPTLEESRLLSVGMASTQAPAHFPCWLLQQVLLLSFVFRASCSEQASPSPAAYGGAMQQLEEPNFKLLSALLRCQPVFKDVSRSSMLLRSSCVAAFMAPPLSGGGRGLQMFWKETPAHSTS